LKEGKSAVRLPDRFGQIIPIMVWNAKIVPKSTHKCFHKSFQIVADQVLGQILV
jgi:hypothetical protein